MNLVALLFAGPWSILADMVSARVVALLLCVLPFCLRAQHSVQPGQNVRVTAPSLGLFERDAVLLAQNGSTLTLLSSHDGRFVVPWSTVTRLLVAQPRTRGQGARHGAKWGLLIGSAAGLVTGLTLDSADKAEDLDAPSVVVSSMIVGSAIGGLVGMLRPGARWRAIHVEQARDSASVAAVAAKDVLAGEAESTAVLPAKSLRGVTPLLELTMAFNFAVHPYAQFPGLAGSLAVNRAIRFDRGLALVVDGELSYLTVALLGGPRLFRRNSSLYAGRRTLTFFGQVLAGNVRGGEEGVMRSTGGFGIQPGGGIDVGGGTFAARIQADYRIVPRSVVEDSRRSPARVGDLSGPRFLLGTTVRLLQ